ncbi:MAG TPA: hypothetical protein VMW65_16780, partial [Chloroflexota bacterium]|nr:hypothetical protein [Chloroflexota bacterium]
ARVTERAARILADLEASALAAQSSASCASSCQPLQPPLPILGNTLPTPTDLLDELLSLDPTTITPLEALNKLWDLQRRAGRG